MAPEQFEGRAVFASDLYSLGVTMYQVLTGTLPYDTPSPADIDRLRRGELASPPRLRNPAIPSVIDQIVMRALSGEVSARYQRAEDFLNDLLAARREIVRRPAMSAAATAAPSVRHVPATPARPTRAGRPTAVRLQTRETPAGRFCWHCRKPLPARGARCPFCGETQ
jgi:serine/threonine-protein kinase